MPDVIYEVLTHSSIEIVGKFKLLSMECNKFTYKFTFMKLHSQRTNIVFRFFIQSMIKNEYHISFVSIDTSKPHPEMSFDFIPDHVEILTSTNQRVLLYHAYHGLCYYVGNPIIKQRQKISNPKTWYDII